MDIAEKRVYDDATETFAVAIASETGLAVAAVSGDIVGEFGLAVQQPIADLAVLPDGRLALATPEDVLVVPVPDSRADPAGVPEPVSTGFGTAEVVTGTGEMVLAASAGTLGSVPAEEPTEPEAAWTPRERPSETLVAADRGLLATSDGVFRFQGDGFTRLGLDDVRTVAAGTRPLAGTTDGVLQLDDNWEQVLAGTASVVTAGRGAAHAVVDGQVHASDGSEWTELPWPASKPPVDLTYARQPERDEPTTVAVTETGTLLIDAGDGWRQRALGLKNVRACAVWECSHSPASGDGLPNA